MRLLNMLFNLKLAKTIIALRNNLLLATQWSEDKDAIRSASEYLAWSLYRSALRGITLQEGFPTAVIWPVPPTPVRDSNNTVITLDDGTPIGKV